MSNRLPNFLIVGAAKSGTTSLYYYLNEHPEIYMSPVKEPLFFCSVGVDKKVLEKEVYPVSLDMLVSNYDAYIQLFYGVSEEKAIGEASVYYLLDHNKTIPNIKKYIPDWRNLNIVIILRNPVDACFSHYQMYSQYLKHFKNQKRILTFEESLEAEEERIKKGYMALSHIHWFFYYEQAKDYLNNFENVKIYLLDDLKNDPRALMKDLFEFIGVDNFHIPRTAGGKYNISGVPKINFVYRFFVRDSHIKKLLRPVVNLWLNRQNKERLINTLCSMNMKKPVITPETREILKNLYRDDIIKLQSLIGRDLSHWID